MTPLVRAALLLLIAWAPSSSLAYIPPRLLTTTARQLPAASFGRRHHGYAAAQRPVVHHHHAALPPPTTALSAASPQPDAPESSSSKLRKRDIPAEAVRIYADYAGRLWNETNPDARRAIATTKAAEAIRQVQHMIRGDEYITQFAAMDDEPRQQLLHACAHLLTAMDNATVVVDGVEAPALAMENATATTTWAESNAVARKHGEGRTTATGPAKKKGRRSILFGATMGLAVAGWVFSGSYIFTGLFTLMTLLGQLEYYRMVINTGGFRWSVPVPCF
jgi:hypothetical protein